MFKICEIVVLANFYNSHLLHHFDGTWRHVTLKGSDKLSHKERVLKIQSQRAGPVCGSLPSTLTELLRSDSISGTLQVLSLE